MGWIFLQADLLREGKVERRDQLPVEQDSRELDEYPSEYSVDGITYIQKTGMPVY